ncbi:hypothetical protein [Chryseobacterium sp. Tr-659]|uniref:hypothetical protein n=1 Tax=Chryseobacterium sp. Tr-659 TaxID=2608340 RepID=UPI001E2DA16A|nr:hypothetical protein [Chryseobacterium sp. Tr-659]
MKKAVFFMLTICSTLGFAQKVSDYKYISIPEKLETFNQDYGLKNKLTKALTGKKYIILPVIKDNWPSEAKNNYCNVLAADILNDKSLFKNKLILQFKDCNNKLVLESKGSSNIKEFEEGLDEALKQALLKVAVSNPVDILPAANSTQTSSSGISTSSVVPVASNYSNGKTDLQKIQIDDHQFILVRSGSSVPFAVFKTTSKNGIFIVKLADGNTTIGYFENDSIVIDIPQADGRYVKEVFTGK